MNNITVPVTLVNKLRNIQNYSVVGIEASECFAKTLIMNKMIEDFNLDSVFIPIIRGSEDLFYEDFIFELCKDADMVRAFLSMPVTSGSFRRLLTSIDCNLERDKYIVVGGYEYIDNELNGHLMEVFSTYADKRLHVILMSNFAFSNNVFDVLNREENILVTSKDLILTRQDILEFFDANGIRLYGDMASDIYKKTLGWGTFVIYALKFFKENGDPELAGCFSRVVDTMIWDNLSKKERHAVISATLFKNFSRSQIMILLESEESFNNTIALNPFIIYDENIKKYHVHPILNERAMDEYNEYPLDERYAILKQTAKVFMLMGNVFESIKYMYMAKDYEGIVNANPTFADFYPYVNSENKELFLSFIKELPAELRYKNLILMINLCLVLFLYNDKENMNLLYSDLENYIKNIYTGEDRNLYIGRLLYTKGLMSYNNTEAMMQNYMSSINILEGSFSGLLDKTPWNYGVPSIIHLYHRTMGALKSECDSLSRCMPFYYRITNGHGKGAEAAFEAELNYITGNFKNAEIYCNKSIYMADTRTQISVSFCSILILTSLAVYEGDFEKFEYYNNAINERSKALKRDLNDITAQSVTDMYVGRVSTLLDSTLRIPEWLKDWESIETHTNMVSQSYANIIYGKYLILNKEYTKLIGISSQFLGLSAIYSNILPRIYTYIYLSIAQRECEEIELSDKYIRGAVDYAIDDFIVMPFVENYSFIENALNTLSFEAEYRDFIKTIKTLSTKFTKGKITVRRKYDNTSNFGLTAREYDVAKLAASRLSNKEIAERLFIAESTVKSNLKEIFTKLGINSRTELYDKF